MMDETTGASRNNDDRVVSSAGQREKERNETNRRGDVMYKYIIRVYENSAANYALENINNFRYNFM